MTQTSDELSVFYVILLLHGIQDGFAFSFRKKSNIFLFSVGKNFEVVGSYDNDFHFIDAYAAIPINCVLYKMDMIKMRCKYFFLYL